MMEQPLCRTAPVEFTSLVLSKKDYVDVLIFFAYSGSSLLNQEWLAQLRKMCLKKL